MIKILKHLKAKEWLLVAIGIVFIVIQVWLDLKLPDYMAEITILVQTPGSSLAAVWEAGGFMLLCALGSLSASIIVGFLAARIAAAFSQRLRSLLFDKVQGFSMQEINKFSTPSLITRSTNDITQVQRVIAMGLQVVIKAPILAVWAILKIADKNWQWTASTAIAVAVLLAVITTIVFLVMPRFRKIQNLTDGLNRLTRENLIGIRVVRAYNAEGYQQEKFEETNADLTATNLFTSRTMAVMFPAMSLIMSGLSLAIYWLGAALINAAGMGDKIVLFSNMIVFSAYAMQVVMAFMMMSMMFIMLPRAAVSGKRIAEVLDTESTILDGSADIPTDGVRGQVEFRHVGFKYPDAAGYLLKDVCFRANRGETVAFIGSTGSGKSTLINLIPRFYDATEGEILVDGINVKEYPLAALHDKIGYVPQKAVLFSGSVKENIAFGDNGKSKPTDEQVEAAIEAAKATDFVQAMTGGSDAAIAQGGTNVSGGQKQRLAIARAICRDPEIYIFDDSFSALDYKTDQLLRRALKAKTADATSLIVSQRIGTILSADRILVLDNGDVVGQGTHQELLKNCEIYRQIAYSQLSKEELENV